MTQQTEKTPSATKARDTYWDGVRGVLIILVIWIHSIAGDPYQNTADAWNFDYWVVARQVLNFPVAFFLFLAGYFVPQDRVSGSWMRSRAVRLLIPFAVWSVIYATITAVSDGGIGNPVVFVGKIALGQSAVHLYFIVVLIQLVVLTPLVLRLLRTRWAWAMFLITPVYVAALYVYGYTVGDLPPLYGTVFAGWTAFYFAGLWVRTRKPRLPAAPIVWAAVVVALVASIGEAYLLLVTGAPVDLAVSQLSATSVVYSFTVFALAFTLKPSIRAHMPRWLVSLGAISYGVYFVHMVWVLALRIPARAILEVWPVLPVVQLAVTGLALLLSVVTVWAARRLLTRPVAERVLGF